MIKLNEKQKRYLLATWFNEYDMFKIFETNDVDKIVKRDIDLDQSTSWPSVYEFGRKITSINTNTYKNEYKKLLSMRG